MLLIVTGSSESPAHSSTSESDTSSSNGWLMVGSSSSVYDAIFSDLYALLTIVTLFPENSW